MSAPGSLIKGPIRLNQRFVCSALIRKQAAWSAAWKPATAGTSGRRGSAWGDRGGDRDRVPPALWQSLLGAARPAPAHRRHSPLGALIKWWALAGAAGGPPEAQSGRDNLIYCSFRLNIYSELPEPCAGNDLQPAAFNPSGLLRPPGRAMRPLGHRRGGLRRTPSFRDHPSGCGELVGAGGDPED